MINETLKLVFSPITYEVPFTTTRVASSIPLPTLVASEYNQAARNEYTKKIADFGLGETVQYHLSVLQNKIVTLEPQRRTADHAAHALKPYDQAEQEWNAKKTAKPFKNYMSRELYTQIQTRIQQEAATLNNTIGIYEWPRAKISYASFLDDIELMVIVPQQLADRVVVLPKADPKRGKDASA